MPETAESRVRHAFTPYRVVDQAASAAVPYLAAAAEADDVLVLHLSPALRECLEASEVGGALDSAAPLGDVVAHPHQTLWALRQLADEAAQSDRGLCVLFEIDPAAHDPIDWVRAEAAANAALAVGQVRALCLCDVGAADPLALAELARAHPTLWDPGTHAPRTNPDFVGTRRQLRILDARRSPDPIEVVRPMALIPLLGMPGLTDVRDALTPMLDEAGIDDVRRDDFLEGVFQVCVNALLHGGDHAEVRLWDTGASVLCRVRDDGEGLVDPLMGYLPPSDGWPEQGSGLWAARQLCDHLTTTMEPEGFTVRMTVDA